MSLVNLEQAHCLERLLPFYREVTPCADAAVAKRTMLSALSSAGSLGVLLPTGRPIAPASDGAGPLRLRVRRMRREHQAVQLAASPVVRIPVHPVAAAVALPEPG